MKAVLTFALLLGFLFASPHAHAVLMTPLAIEELSTNADLVVHGTVLGKTCQRDSAGRIFTKIDLKIIEVWKGTLTNATLTIFQGGGTVGDERMEVSGEAEYGVGEEVVAFLVLNQRGEPITLALAQGKFHVWQDKPTGEKFTHNIFHGAGESARGETVTTTNAPSQRKLERLQLNELKSRVRKEHP